jgi:hypothetical protein
MNSYGRYLMVTSCLAMMACATPVPVATHSLRCDASAELLTARCEYPQPVADDATFATVVDVMHKDRQALLECGLRMAALQESIIRCNRQTDQLNTRLDKINEKNHAN